MPDRFNEKKADWKRFTTLTAINLDTYSINDIDRLVRTVEQHIHIAATASMPVKSGVYSKSPVPWYNQEVREARQERVRALRALKRNHTVANKIAYNRLKAKCRYVQLQAQRKAWQEYVSSINSQVSRHQIWKKVGKIAGKFTPTPTPVLRLGDGNLVNGHGPVAEMLAESFAAVSRNQNYTPQFLQYKIRTERRPLSFNEPTADEQSYNSPFKMEELKAALKMTQ